MASFIVLLDISWC